MPLTFPPAERVISLEPGNIALIVIFALLLFFVSCTGILVYSICGREPSVGPVSYTPGFMLPKSDLDVATLKDRMSAILSFYSPARGAPCSPCSC